MSELIRRPEELDLSTPIALDEEAIKADAPAAALAIAAQGEQYREAASSWRSYALQLHRRDVRSLSTGDAFVVWDGDTRVRCIKTRVRLTVEEGHLYQVQGRWSISATGYTSINRIAGVSIVQPEEIVVDGRVHENPWLEMDPGRPGVLRRVHARCLAIGRGATGQPQVIDERIKWDPGLYLAEGLKKVQMKRKGSGANAVIDILETEYKEGRASGELRGWGFLAIAAVGDDYLGIAFDAGHPEVRAKLGDQVDLVKFAERRAQTICRRRALQNHPALATKHPAVTITAESGGQWSKPTAGYADVEVYAWPPDTRSLDEVGAMVVAGTRGVGQLTDGAEVQVETGEITIDPETGEILE